MTFDKQVEKIKEEKLKHRITRDIIFITLGIVFLVISIFISYKDSKNMDKNDNLKENKPTIVTTKKS